MSADANRVVVHRYFEELLNKRDKSATERLFLNRFTFHAPTVSRDPLTRAGFVQFIDTCAAAFPDYIFTMDDEVVEDDKVVVRWTFTATHKGEFAGLPATGRLVSCSGVDWFELAQGRIASIRVEANLAGLLHQLGLLPSIAPRYT